MPVTVVATIQVKPESVDTVREIMNRTVAEVHQEPGCDLYSLHETNGTFIFVEQWADDDALAVHGTAPAVTQMFAEVGEHLAGAPDIKVAQAVVAGDPTKGLAAAPDERLREEARILMALTNPSRAGSRSSPEPPAAKAVRTPSGWRPRAPTSSPSTSATRSHRSPTRWPPPTTWPPR